MDSVVGASPCFPNCSNKISGKSSLNDLGVFVKSWVTVDKTGKGGYLACEASRYKRLSTNTVDNSVFGA